MQFSWLIKTNSEKLIVFFNGWGMDENVVRHLKASNYDVVIFYDYCNLEVSDELVQEINNYKEISIIAWSFGVWASSSVIREFNNIKNSIAINGTLLPIDDKLGIPEKIFNFTLKTLSETTYKTFFKNMFSDFSDDYFNKLPSRSVKNQKEELIKIQNQSKEKDFCENVNYYKKSFISNRDKIIPSKNQLEFWTKNNCNKIIYVDKGHCIFDFFKTWDEIINYG